MKYIYRDSDGCRLPRKYDIFYSNILKQQEKTMNGNAVWKCGTKNNKFVPQIGKLKLPVCGTLEDAIELRRKVMKEKFPNKYVEYFPLDFINE
jgi:hypothetical protein